MHCRRDKCQFLTETVFQSEVSNTEDEYQNEAASVALAIGEYDLSERWNVTVGDRCLESPTELIIQV